MKCPKCQREQTLQRAENNTVVCAACGSRFPLKTPVQPAAKPPKTPSAANVDDALLGALLSGVKHVDNAPAPPQNAETTYPLHSKPTPPFNRPTVSPPRVSDNPFATRADAGTSKGSTTPTSGAPAQTSNEENRPSLFSWSGRATQREFLGAVGYYLLYSLLLGIVLGVLFALLGALSQGGLRRASSRRGPRNARRRTRGRGGERRRPNYSLGRVGATVARRRAVALFNVITLRRSASVDDFPRGLSGPNRPNGRASLGTAFPNAASATTAATDRDAKRVFARRDADADADPDSVDRDARLAPLFLLERARSTDGLAARARPLRANRRLVGRAPVFRRLYRQRDRRILLRPRLARPRRGFRPRRLEFYSTRFAFRQTRDFYA